MHLYSLVSMVPGALFTGTLIIVPFLFIIHLLRLCPFGVNKMVLIQSINTVLLLAAVWYLLILLTELCNAIFSGGGYMQYAFVNKYTGPFWFYGLIEILKYILIPQLLWFKKLRVSIMSSVIMVLVWSILYIITWVLMVHQFSYAMFLPGFSYYLQALIIYTVVVAITYFILNRRVIRFINAVN